MTPSMLFETWPLNETYAIYDLEDDLNVTSHQSTADAAAASTLTIAIFSALFFTIGTVGIAGNLLVILAIASDQSMRRSVTNLFITNLAFSDLIIMLVCIPEIAQFMQNRGWTLGLSLCRILRFLEVSALYVSVMTLVGVCIERYVAIIHPMRAHITCSRSRILLIIAFTWSAAMLCASPNLLFHQLVRLQPEFKPCVLQFAGTILYKYAEFFLFYLVPLVLQVTLYVRIGLKLFHPPIECQRSTIRESKLVSATRSRRGVVKMLMVSVGVYFISFSPHQVLLVYNTLSPRPFRETWSYLIFVNIMAYVSSACNPLLYSIFSQNFRRQFGVVLSRCIWRPRLPSAGGTPEGTSKKKYHTVKIFGTSVSEL